MLGRSRFLVACLIVSSLPVFGASPEPLLPSEEVLVSRSPVGIPGGRLVVALRAEPKTLNPAISQDAPSRDVLGRMHADLIHINRASQLTEPALAKSYKVSHDGLHYTVKLRKGIRFSDGDPFDADDIVFTFKVYMDEKVHSPQRDLLILEGKPISVQKLDQHTVRFDLSAPYAAAERLFDSMYILPKHLLEKPYSEGKLAEAWSVNAEAARLVGLGPYRMRQYVPGQRIVLERNPYYWKADGNRVRLPYIDELVFLIVPSEDAQVIRFQAGDTDIISRFGADNYSTLEKTQADRGYRVQDLGPGLEYNFLFFNLNAKVPASGVAEKQTWFKDVRFRRAVSLAIDRNAIVRLVYRGRGTPLWAHVTPANKLWLDANVPKPARSPDQARALLREAGFNWNSANELLDSRGKRVEFTIASSASNAQRTQMATIIQDDLKQLGMKVQVVPLEFRSLIDRVFQSHDYDAAVLALGAGDVDPNPQINVWLTNGTNHLWSLGEPKPSTAWEAEIDRLMRRQISTLNTSARKKMYDRLQQLVYENLPIICLASPNILVGSRNSVKNLQPAILEHYILWNVDEIYIQRPQ
jgi:peptide/nickel transport system substrate-binding protein